MQATKLYKRSETWYRCELDNGPDKYLHFEKDAAEIAKIILELGGFVDDVTPAEQPRTLSDVRREKVDEALRNAEECSAPFLRPYPESEQKLWPDMIAEALDGGGPLLQTCGVTPEKVLEKREVFRTVGAFIIVRKKQIFEELETAGDDLDALKNVDTSFEYVGG